MSEPQPSVPAAAVLPGSGPVPEGPFDPPQGGWRRVSPKLATARRVTGVPVLVLLFGGATAVLFAVGAPVWIPWVVAAVGLAVVAWFVWLTGRQAAAIGYAERAEDLLVTRGIMFKELVIVPYGRMQLVDVQAGPIDRRLGIARIQLHTAAATTDASIPGLPTDEAHRLRDRLAALGEARSAGL